MASMIARDDRLDVGRSQAVIDPFFGQLFKDLLSHRC